jgi:hypothetical protein
MTDTRRIRLYIVVTAQRSAASCMTTDINSSRLHRDWFIPYQTVKFHQAVYCIVKHTYCAMLCRISDTYCILLYGVNDTNHTRSCIVTDTLWINGPGSSVSIATGYGLDGQGIESRWGRDFPHLSRPALWPTQPPVQWVLGLSRG